MNLILTTAAFLPDAIRKRVSYEIHIFVTEEYILLHARD